MNAPVPNDEGLLLRRSQPLVFVADLDLLELSDADRHHLSKALRVADGTEITVSDGAGRWRSARFGPVLEPDGEVLLESRPSTELTVAFTPVKGDRPEWTVQKLTELGIDRIIPLQTERSVVRWDDQRAAKQLVRLERVAREAAQQSRRVWLPRIDPVTSFRTLIESGSVPGTVALADPDGRPLEPRHHAVCIGPEGGWSEHERLGIPAEQHVSLPGGVLRAETAALCAASIMALHRRATMSL